MYGLPGNVWGWSTIDEEEYTIPWKVIDTIPLVMTVCKAVKSVEFKSIIVAFITSSLSSCINDTMFILSTLIPMALAMSDSMSV